MTGAELVQLVPTASDRVFVTAQLPELSPDAAFDHFVEPSLLVRWWVPVAVVEPWSGGHYRFSWPQQGWVLSGSFGRYERGETLSFSWQWQHRPDLPERQVFIKFEPDGASGSRLALTHDAYTDALADQEDRQSHIDGWLYFLGQLAEQSGEGARPL